ncbi:MAG: SHOCT domain-containing protein [Kiloniellales bacterium]
MTKAPRLAAVASLTGLAGGAALADSTDRALAHPMMWGGWGWPGMIIGPLVMIAVLAVIIAVAVLLVRWIVGAPAAAPPPMAGPPAKTALDILNERFAKGEIDKEDFEERRRLLSQ